MIPPNASNGRLIKVYMIRITTMVPIGSAAVVPLDIATILRIEITTNDGPKYNIPDRITLFSWKIRKWISKERRKY